MYVYISQVTFEEFWQVVVRFGSEEGEDFGRHPSSWTGGDSEKEDEKQWDGEEERNESLLRHELRGLSAHNLLAGSQSDEKGEEWEGDSEDLG